MNLDMGCCWTVGYYGDKGHSLVELRQDINQPTRQGHTRRELAGDTETTTDSELPTADNSVVDQYHSSIPAATVPINVYMPTFSSNYHSLQTSLQKRFKGNNLISANYTWSKALSNLHFPAEYSVPQVDQRRSARLRSDALQPYSRI